MSMSSALVDAAAPTGGGDLKSVLVIEDDPDIAEVITSELRSNGYRVEHSVTVESGLEAFRASRPSAILVDRVLHGEDGLRIVETLRAEGDKISGSVDQRPLDSR